jgi:curved DNA-binding protein CbpA
MGNLQSFPVAHQRIYQNLLGIQIPATRVQVIQTMLSSPEHLESARAGGIYGHLLHYVQQVKEGKQPPELPGEVRAKPPHVTNQMQHNLQQIQDASSFHRPPQAQPQQQQQSHVERQQRLWQQQQQHMKQQQQEWQQLRPAENAIQTIPVEQKGSERAMNYFSACLKILELEEEVALTEEGLKAAYKKAVLTAHPDKGGSEKEFEAVTRAYAYLGEILKRINGGRTTASKVEAPNVLTSGRQEEATAWKMTEPIRLNPNKIDMNAFNTMYEKTRIPDPEESGYGDWLKGEGAGEDAPKFGGKFNRDVFHRAFEDEQKARPAPKGGAIVAQELSLASRLGFATELGRTGREDYTVAANETGLAYTDLKKAYTEYNTFSHQTSGVQIEKRSAEQLGRERESAPAPLADREMEQLAESERAATAAEENRRLRLAQEAIRDQKYFERMKLLVLRN